MTTPTTQQTVAPKKRGSEAPASPSNALDHLDEAARTCALLPNLARIELIRKGTVIEHSALTRALDHTDWLLTTPEEHGSHGMLLMGDSGSGKTTFGELVQAIYAKDDDRRIVIIDASGARTMREVYGRVLQSLDGPVSRTMHTPDREMAVIRILRLLKVRALVVDEIQSVAEGTPRDQRRVLDGLKYLMNVAKVPLICLGAPESERSLVTDRHLAQRLKVFRLEPWKVDNDFLDFLLAVLAQLPLRKPSLLRDERVLAFLIKASSGGLRRIMSIVTSAAVQAVLSGEERLTLRGLMDAVDVPSRQVREEGVHGD